MTQENFTSSLSGECRSHILERMESFEGDSGHMRHVADLAVQLFDALRPLHNETDKARAILEAAALLHDIGFAVSEQGHHKHSRDLILKHPIPGFSEEETRAVASVARYHRRAEPSMKHPLLAKLSEPTRQTVRHLSALLRVADGLDRSHHSSVLHIECEILDICVLLKLTVRGETGLDLEGLNRKKGYFESLFGRTLMVELKTDASPNSQKKKKKKPRRSPKQPSARNK